MLWVRMATALLSLEASQAPRRSPESKPPISLLQLDTDSTSEDGTIDHTAKPTNLAGTGHKLGPKTNAGAINANLRALDRSGKPCRKWARKAFAVKSFTGVSWDLPSWKGGEKPIILGRDDSSEAKEVSQLSSSENKPNNDSDVAMSNTGEPLPDTNGVSLPPASSPPTASATPAIIAAQG